ncbi:hypothetical protein DACRYDRAFT_20167 [Dacryopinax primogenitus]|uniref:Uncharacterized protein n=1 Tax=Dacryopinax primogenitus (strain DJM 731) TaxID=1858805 RepID=M5GBK3_DACPD|nr:uncharacterized protein DACRYDRAFT_20167 [Dacryopinax primogenitus]EJU05785.1 hypothetical protein DACRYDRAFT_20167 [Dacryopinax primogenitus]
MICKALPVWRRGFPEVAGVSSTSTASRSQEVRKHLSEGAIARSAWRRSRGQARGARRAEALN